MSFIMQCNVIGQNLMNLGPTIKMFIFSDSAKYNGEHTGEVCPKDDPEAKNHHRVVFILGHLLLLLLLLLVQLGGHDGGDGPDCLGVGSGGGD